MTRWILAGTLAGCIAWAVVTYAATVPTTTTVTFIGKLPYSHTVTPVHPEMTYGFRKISTAAPAGYTGWRGQATFTGYTGRFTLFLNTTSLGEQYQYGYDFEADRLVTAQAVADPSVGVALRNISTALHGKAAASELAGVAGAVGRVLGLSHENVSWDRMSYNNRGQLVGARLRTYTNATSVGTDRGVLAVYSSIAAGAGGNFTYQTIKRIR